MNPESGAVEFGTVMERFKMTKEPRIREGMLRLPVQYFVFDVLQHNGRDLRGLPLIKRRKVLDEILTNNAHYSKIMQVGGGGTALFNFDQTARIRRGSRFEGKNSLYVSRRSDKWKKVISYQTAVVELAAYRKDQFGWPAHYNDRPAGIIELAVPAAHRKAYFRIAKSIVTGEDRNFVYVQPHLQARVRFRNWTKAGILRAPELWIGSVAELLCSFIQQFS